MPIAPYLMNPNIHSDNEDNGYKNPQKPKSMRYTTIIPKNIPKLNFFAIYFN